MEGNPRPTESSSDVKFEIGHVLFIDIEPDLVEQLMDGLRKAGLEIGDKAEASTEVKASDSGMVRAD